MNDFPMSANEMGMSLPFAVTQPPPFFFHNDNGTDFLAGASNQLDVDPSGAFLQLTPEEEFFHRILMKYQKPELPPRTRLISVWWSAVVGTFFIFSTIFGIVGNATVFIAIAGDKVMRRSAMNMLLLNLAIADMLNLITIVLEWSPAVLYGYPAWDFPRFLCPLTRYLECTFLFASILTQLVVCVERYIAIVYPIHVRRLCTRQNILLLACTTWVVALMFSLPLCPPIKCVNSHGHSVWWILYKWFEFLAAYAVPCAIMIFLYGKVACVLWSKNAHLHEGAQRPSALHADEKTRFEALDMRRGIIKSRNRGSKMLVACVLIYFVSYSPIQGIFIMTAMFGPNSKPPYSVVLLLNAFAVMCSACNPLLYTLFSKKFRQRILHLLTCGRHGSLYSRNDITYSFAKAGATRLAKSKKQKNCALPTDHHVLLTSNVTPDESKRYVTITGNSPTSFT
ncbi:Neuropeptide receptor 15 [Aphelenchoides fujianensis]|nr:Neuropeptide receptor 15 [Aphelenchoides fujianensis]